MNFRSAMRGYNKEDVNRFILESDRLRREAEAELQEKIRLISEERDTLRSELSASNESLKNANEQLEEKINALIESDATIEALRQEIVTAEGTAKEWESVAKETEVSLSSTKIELQKAENELVKCNEKLSENEKQLSRIHDENQKLSANLSELQDAVCTAEKDNKTLSNENETLREEITLLQAKQNEAVVSHEINPESAGDLILEIETLKAELVKANMENEALQNKIASMPSDITDDMLQSKLGEVILQANRTAEQIIREANNTAMLIKTGAVEEATVIKKNFEEKMVQRAERAERLLSELSQKYFLAFEATKDELANQVSALLTEQQAALSETAATLQKQTEEGLLLTDAQAAALLN